MEKGIEQREVTKPSIEVVDLLSGKYRIHWTVVEKLDAILSGGICSQSFAERIKDGAVRPRTTDASAPDYVWVMPLDIRPPTIYSGYQQEDEPQMVGIVVEVSQYLFVPRRIAPRKFTGLILIDEDYAPYIKPRNFVLERVEQIKSSFESGKAKPLLIYGISGDLYWPRRMTHGEIVRMLAERQ